MSKLMYRIYYRDINTKKYLLLAAFTRLDHAINFLNAHEQIENDYKITQGNRVIFRIER